MTNSVRLETSCHPFTGIAGQKIPDIIVQALSFGPKYAFPLENENAMSRAAFDTSTRRTFHP